MKYDVVVVGAGPGGATTARFAARKGLKVLMLDKRREIGYPVQCGEFMTELEEIKRMFPRCDVIDELFNTPESLISLRTNVIEMYSPKGKGYPLPFKGYTLNRREYDKFLVDLALKEGAELKTNTLVKKVQGNEVVTSVGSFEAKVIVGADGPISKVAECKGFQKNEVMAPAITCQVDGDFEPVVKTYFGDLAPGGYAWIIPKKGCANVGLGVQQNFTNENVRTLFDRFMESKGFKSRDITGGHVPLSGPLKTTVKSNTILVGDSAGMVMASNGGGIPTALICGNIAGEVIGDHILKGKPLQDYETIWRSAIGKELKNALNTKTMADRVFGSGFWLGFAMRCLGRTGLSRAIRCQRTVPW